ncbi:MAG TPA: VanW family protein [Actinopolymorphaceae bacterium]|jgi:vancomycin resistance protein YoaR
MIGAGAAVVVLATVYVIAAFATAGRLPREASVAGVDVGGKTPAAARTLTVAAFAERLNAPVHLSAGTATLDTTLAQAGVGFDAGATLSRSGRLFDPARIGHVIFGHDEIEPAFVLDSRVLDATLAPLAVRAEVEPVDGGVTFAHGKVVTKRAVTGHTLDTAGSGSALLAAVTATGARLDRPLALPRIDRLPTITQAAVDRAVEDFAAPAVSASVRVNVGPTSFRAQPSTFARALSMRPSGGELRPVVDASALRAILAAPLAKAETTPTSARIVIRDGKPVIVGGEDGLRAPTEKLASALMSALPKSGADRVARVDVVTTPTAHGRAPLAKLGVTETVGSFTTKYPYAAYRNQNIGRAAELVNGTLLAPGETFSLNGIVGERTEANGFTTGFVIQDGRLRQDLGGGVSQLATTLYNAAFFAGLQDVEHRTHAFYIDRYPPGREATVYWGSIDLRFRNNTPYGVYVQTHVAKGAPGRSGVVTVTLWGTKYWQVTTTTSDRHGFRAPVRIVDPGSKCVPQVGTAGFDVDITRRISRNGKLVKTERYTTSYAAEDAIACTG